MFYARYVPPAPLHEYSHSNSVFIFDFFLCWFPVSRICEPISDAHGSISNEFFSPRFSFGSFRWLDGQRFWRQSTVDIGKSATIDIGANFNAKTVIVTRPYATIRESRIRERRWNIQHTKKTVGRRYDSHSFNSISRLFLLFFSSFTVRLSDTLRNDSKVFMILISQYSHSFRYSQTIMTIRAWNVVDRVRWAAL